MSKAQHAFLQAYGDMLAAIPQMQELVEYRREMSYLSDSERRQKLATKAQELGLTAMSMFLPAVRDIPDEAWDERLRDVFPSIMAQVAEILPDISMREAMDFISGKLLWDDFLVDYIEEYYETGEPPKAYEQTIGGVGTVKIGPAGSKMPVVFAAISPHTPLEETIEGLRDEVARAFKDIPVTKPGTAAEVARYLYLTRTKGMSNSEIAWRNLVERDSEIASTPKSKRKGRFPDAYRKEMRRLQQMSTRGIDRLTQLSPPVSSDSE